MEASLNNESGLFIYPGKIEESICKEAIELAGNDWESSEVESDKGSDVLDVKLMLFLVWALLSLIWTHIMKFQD